MGNVTFTRGREWWLERTDKDGMQRYPKTIDVGGGDPDDTVRYVPENASHTCRYMGGCGQGLLQFDGVYDPETDGYLPFGAYLHTLSCGHYVITEDMAAPNYCTECGSRVVAG